MSPTPPEPKVQLNIPVLWTRMQHLERVAEARHVSKAQAVRDALEMAYPQAEDPADIARRFKPKRKIMPIKERFEHKDVSQEDVLKARQDTAAAGATE